jgi:hypothetical protein
MVMSDGITAYLTQVSELLKKLVLYFHTHLLTLQRGWGNSDTHSPPNKVIAGSTISKHTPG